MAIIVYRSTDASAPALQGVAGRLIAVLDACLVTGYGSKPAAGWTKAFTGTNLAAYRMTTAGSATGYYLRVDDTGTTAARVVGYQTMSDINTGTNVFPTPIQLSGGAFMWKSSTADTVARPWVVVADNTNPRCFYMFIQGDDTVLGSGLSTAGIFNNYFFGDLITRKTSDGSQCFLMAAAQAATSTAGVGGTMNNSGFTAIAGHWVAKNYVGTLVSQTAGKARDTRTTVATSTMGVSDSSVFPNRVTNALDLATIMIHESAVVMRGYLPGAYEPQGGSVIGNYYDEIAGQGSFAGTNWLLCPTKNTNSAIGSLFLTTTGSTWY